MKEHKLISKLSYGLQLESSWDFRLAVGIATLVATISTIFLAYKFGYVGGQEEFETLYRASCTNCIYLIDGNSFHTLNALHVDITLALIIGAAGLWLRKIIGLFLSLIASISIFGIYIWWYLDTLHFLRYTIEVPMNDPYYKEVGLLHGALSWDWVILIVAIVLFTWELKTLMRTLRNSMINVN
jgi:hypothetical protein